MEDNRDGREGSVEGIEESNRGVSERESSGMQGALGETNSVILLLGAVLVLVVLIQWSWYHSMHHQVTRLHRRMDETDIHTEVEQRERANTTAELLSLQREVLKSMEAMREESR